MFVAIVFFSYKLLTDDVGTNQISVAMNTMVINSISEIHAGG